MPRIIRLSSVEEEKEPQRQEQQRVNNEGDNDENKGDDDVNGKGLFNLREGQDQFIFLCGQEEDE